MASLRQLLSRHVPMLLLDTAGLDAYAGWLPSAELGNARWASGRGEAGIELFRSIEALGADLADAQAFAFCESPGSVLGIRTAAMAIRTWRALRSRPVFAYHALALLAEAADDADGAAVWIADARRGSWHVHRRGGTPRVVSGAELGGGPFATPAEFRRWSPLPERAREIAYDLPRLLRRAADADLFHATEAPDAFLHAEPKYATWDGKVHAAP